MGLDMYAYATDEKLESETDFDLTDEAVQFYYWRKHPNLHGWMERLYRLKGGEEIDFNCVTVVVTATDLDVLEAAVRENRLPKTEGFFFGESTPEDREDDLAFIAEARARISEGDTVFYTSWW